MLNALLAELLKSFLWKQEPSIPTYVGELPRLGTCTLGLREDRPTTRRCAAPPTDAILERLF